MSGREGVLDEPLVETLSEPPDDGTPAPGERAGMGAPSASLTHWLFNLFFTHSYVPYVRESFWTERSLGTPLDKVDVAFGFIARIAFAIRFSYDFVGFTTSLDSVRLRWVRLSYAYFVFVSLLLLCSVSYFLILKCTRKLHVWLQEKHSKLYIEHQRISGGQATVYACSTTNTTNAPAVPVIRLPYHKKVCTLNILPGVKCWTSSIKISHDPSALDTAYIALCLPYYATGCGALYYAICGRGRVWGILYVVYDVLRQDFYWIAHTLELYVRVRRCRGRYSQAGLDPL